MTLFAAYESLPLITSIAVWGGLVIAAIYMLRAVRDVLHGPLPVEFDRVSDAQGWWRKLPFALLFITLLFFGVWPRALTEKIRPAAQRIVELSTSGRAVPGAPAPTLAQVETSEILFTQP